MGHHGAMATRGDHGERRQRGGRARRGRSLLAGLGAVALVVVGAVAAPVAPPVGAATTTLTAKRTISVPLGTTYPSVGTNEYFSSPAIADLNADDSPDLVVAAPNGTVTATRLSNGQRLWQRKLGNTTIHASPLVEDMDGNGTVEVIAATMTGRVYMLNGQTGAIIRTFAQGPPLHCPAGQDCRPDGFFATPAIGDVNGDGIKDIVAPSFDHTVYAWSRGGTLLWRAYLEDTLWSSPAIVDIDRNGRNEVVLGGDIWAGNPFRVPAGGLLWVLNGRNGTRLNGYPISIPGQTVWSSPAITDLDGDGRLDAVFGTGSNFPSSATTRRVYAYTLTTRRPVPGWPVSVTGQVVQQPAVGDIDNDGAREVVVATQGGYVRAFEANGSQRWAVCNRTTGSCPMSAGTQNGVAIADIDNDGVQEVVATNERRIRVFSANNGAQEAEFPLAGNYAIAANVPAISELNGEAIIVHTGIYRSGTTPVEVRSQVLGTGQALCAEDWPQFKRGPRRTSVQPDRQPWHPFPCARPFVTQQYRDLLGRGIDAGGLAYWTARLRTTWTGQRVVHGFMSSPEFAGVAAPVVRMHIALRSGPPGPSSEVRAGMAILQRDPGDTATVASRLLDGMENVTDAQLVDLVFPRLTGRTPSGTERANALSAIQANGRARWVADLSATTSAVTNLRAEVLVAMTYIGLLDRAPDSGGYAFWVERVDSGTSPQRLIEQFLNTPEYRNRVS